MFNNIKMTLHYSVYVCTSGEEVRTSDESERVQSVSYFNIRSLSWLYAVVCLRKGKRSLPWAPFAAVMCKVPFFQRGPTATVMYKEATLLSKGHPTAVVMCKYLALKGAQSNCNA